MTHGEWRLQRVLKVCIYVVCIFLAILSLFPFVIMIVNGTRSTPEIQRGAISLIPSTNMLKNLRYLNSSRTFVPLTGFFNSLLISGFATAVAIYFSSLTAYALVAYNWRFRQPFFSFIIGIMMIPAQITTIGFYQFIFQLGLTNNYLPLILPSIAAPTVVFFMRQYLVSTLSIDIVDSARIDGAGEFFAFNRIMLPIMKPAIATQAIFIFVASWNSLFLPMVLLTEKSMYTMPIMVSLLMGDFYRQELGSIYLGLALTVVPLFVVYFTLSRYIIAGVALGGVKE